MLYDGKRPNELTADELDAAEAYCLKTMRDANAVYDLNRLGMIELQEERSRRAIQKLN